MIKLILLQSRIDELEQIQRECNVRVMGFPEHGENDANTKSKLMQMVGAQEGSEKNIASITRLGKPRNDKCRDLIVKFVSKESSDHFYARRKNTPKSHDNKKVYINEDLTESKAKLFYDARQMVKRSRLYGTWSQNGNIIVKVRENDNPCAVRNHLELRSKVNRSVYDSEECADDGMSTMSEQWDYEPDLSDHCCRSLDKNY